VLFFFELEGQISGLLGAIYLLQLLLDEEVELVLFETLLE